MLCRTHAVFGFVSYFLLSYFLEMPFFVLVFVLLGAGFVDIDSYRSRVGNRWWVRPLQWLTKHRGFLHSLVAAIVLSLVIGTMNLWGGFGFFIGYISHLLLDCFTYMGVRLFWPFNFRIRGFIRSGSWVEDIVFVLFLLLGVLMVFEKLF